jgi:hypothetical protein
VLELPKVIVVYPKGVVVMETPDTEVVVVTPIAEGVVVTPKAVVWAVSKERGVIFTAINFLRNLQLGPIS